MTGPAAATTLPATPTAQPGTGTGTGPSTGPSPADGVPLVAAAADPTPPHAGQPTAPTVSPAPRPAARTTALIAHGSPDPRHAADIAAIAARLSALQGADVVPMFLEHNPPRADDLLPTMGVGGDLAVLPLLLTAGFHWRHDIPAVVAADAGRTVLLAPPPPELFAGAVVDLLATWDAARAVVALAGSRSPRLAPRMAALADRIDQIQALQEGPAVEVLLARDPDAAASLMDGDTVVVPFVVAEGIFADRIRAAADRAGARTTPVLGSTRAFTAALAAYTSQDPR